MKLDYATVAQLYGALTRMDSVYGFKTGYAIAMTRANLKAQAEYFEKRRIELIKKYGTEKDDGYFVEPDKIPDFTVEFKELCEMEVDVEIEQADTGTTMKDFRCEGARPTDYLIVAQYLIPKESREDESGTD